MKKSELKTFTINLLCFHEFSTGYNLFDKLNFDFSKSGAWIRSEFAINRFYRLKYSFFAGYFILEIQNSCKEQFSSYGTEKPWIRTLCVQSIL